MVDLQYAICKNYVITLVGVMAKETLRGINWSYEETVALIECWSSEEAASDFAGIHRNKHIYEKIATGMYFQI